MSAQGLLAGHGGAAAAGEQAEAVVQALRDLLDGQRPDPGRGQLDARAGCRRAAGRSRRRRARSPASSAKSGSVAVRARRRGGRTRSRPSASSVGCVERRPGMASDGTRQVASPGDPSGSRLVASTVERGQAPSSVRRGGRRRDQVLAVVERGAAGPCSRRKSVSASSGGWPGESADRRAPRDLRHTSSGSPSGASSTSQTRRGSGRRRSAAIWRVRRVLPVPPRPTSVTQAVRSRERADLGDLPLPPDEASAVPAGCRRLARAERREVGGQAGGAELEDVLRAAEVLEAVFARSRSVTPGGRSSASSRGAADETRTCPPWPVASRRATRLRAARSSRRRASPRRPRGGPSGRGSGVEVGHGWSRSDVGPPRTPRGPTPGPSKAASSPSPVVLTTVPRACSDGLAEDRVVRREGDRHRRRLLLPEPGAPGDVGHEERRGS